jgi:hypothetical protein
MIKDFLHWINRVPFPVAAKHYVSFGVSMPKEAVLKEGWNTLRSAHPRYNFSGDRTEWLQEIYDNTKDAQDPEIDQRARDIVALCTARSITSIFSVGAGAAGLEYRIAKLAPEISVTISEYFPDSVKKLSAVFHEGKVRAFDALDEKAWKEISPKTLVLLYRLDREFSPAQWRSIFTHMHNAGMQNALFVLQYTFTILWYIQERIRVLRAMLLAKKVLMVGHIHNVPSLRNLWGSYYGDTPIRIGSWQGFFLAKK